MIAIEKLYDDVVMNHIKHARNYRKMEKADAVIEEFNPLCGDQLTVYLKFRDEIIDDISFQCSCCGISMASASMMTEAIQGKSKSQAIALSRQLISVLEQPPANDEIELNHSAALAVLETIQDFPSRVSCATLAWKALEKAIDN